MRAAHERAESARERLERGRGDVADGLRFGGLAESVDAFMADLDLAICDLKQIAADTLGPLYTPGHTQRGKAAEPEQQPMPHRQMSLLATRRRANSL